MARLGQVKELMDTSICSRIVNAVLFLSLQERQRECAEAMDRIAVERCFDYWGLFDGLTRLHEEWQSQPAVLLSRPTWKRLQN